MDAKNENYYATSGKGRMSLNAKPKKRKQTKPLETSKFPVQLIQWDDHCSAGDGWHKPADSRDCPLKCESVGFVVKENKKYLTLAQNRGNENRTVGDLMVLVKSCITKRKTLK